MTPEPKCYAVYNPITDKIDVEAGCFRSHETAKAAAIRRTNRWRALIAIPLFGPEILLGVTMDDDRPDSNEAERKQPIEVMDETEITSGGALRAWRSIGAGLSLVEQFAAQCAFFNAVSGGSVTPDQAKVIFDRRRQGLSTTDPNP